MSIRTWLRFLIGDREAILEIAGNRQALLIGFLFVLSAAFAREYDQEDLLRQPGYLLIPFGVSLLAASILFAMAFGGVKGKGLLTPRLFVGFAMFLGLFWMTAPIAWLYAVPYERFLSPLDATKANLWTLAVVSLWRVALMIRVISVLMQYPPFGSIGLVMFIADVEALLGLFFLPWPLIDVMGGLMMSENEALKRSTTNTVAVLGCWTLPVWFVGFCYAMSRKDLAWQGPLTHTKGVRAGGLVTMAIASVLIWAIILPFSQPAVIRKNRIDQLFTQGNIAAALEEMSHLGSDAFPPMWDPPPHHVAQKPPIHEVLAALNESKSPQWIVDIYLHKVKRLHPETLLYGGDDKKELLLALRRLPGRRNLIEAWINHEDYGRALESRFTELGVWPPDEDASGE